MASEADVTRATGAPVGFAGPVGLKGVESIVADHAISGLRGAVAGANAADVHWTNVDEGRDFTVTRFADLRLAGAGDPCPRCNGVLRAFRGIEVGHVFYLGTKYTEALNCTFLDATGRVRPMVMGCYGIGVSRVLAAAVEQNHDDRGIVWPKSIAPYKVSILPLQMNKPDVVAAAEGIYAELQAAGVEVLLDDRTERAGSKFADAELIGSPLQIAIGARGLKEGMVELKQRATGEMQPVALDAVVARARELLGE
jgi:prolyl-tRNA synthetase